MTPNIERSGRMVRAVMGLVCLAAGVAVWVWGGPEGVVLRWALRIGLPLAGAFQLFEARQRWCVLRHYGVDTPL
jgi:hypothetical protein